MKTCGIVAEYNPFHKGHLYHIRQTRALLGEDCRIVCVMSGNFVQRGEPALFSKHTRTAAALRCGADLVLELPLPFAMAPAERFAGGAVRILDSAGVVEYLSFGSESGRLNQLEEIAACLDSPAMEPLLTKALQGGCSYPAARQQAASLLLGSKADLLKKPNNLLGVSYLRAMRRQNSALVPITISRTGARHDQNAPAAEIASASYLRQTIIGQNWETAVPFVPPEALPLYQAELESGLAPATMEAANRAVLARLRAMTPAEFEALPASGGGLADRFMAAARAGGSLSEILETCKTKRYTLAHLRRLLLLAYLRVTREDWPDQIPYLRVLGLNGRGRSLLREMRKKARLPVIVKPAHAGRLEESCRRLFELEARATDLYQLFRPRILPGGMEWKQGPVVFFN